ncbi:MAG: DNA primase [Porticoccaceae bacterium]
MAGRIPQSFIDNLLDRLDMVEIVGSRLDLRKAGKNYTARCPFHDEKTPSFSVSPEKQFYYCFGCGAGGNAIGFVMDYDRVDFPTAVTQLANQAGMALPQEAARENPQDQRRNALYLVLEKADRYYRAQLREHPAAATAVDYLRQRGVSGEIARDFGIGFAPPGWNSLTQSLGDDDGTLADLKDCGLLVIREEDNRTYDRFRFRILFPIRDTRGRTIGFGGRVLGDDKPKYLNSPETPLFHKGRELYGLYEARLRLREIPSLLVVEGYMDVIALAQHGVYNAVATLGTAATADHLTKLYRYSSEVVFCFDGDTAGRQAAKRALETCLPLMTDGRSAKFLFLPDGEDPDTLVRKIGADGFRALVRDAMPLSQFLFEQAAEGLNLETPDHRARLCQRMTPLIKRIPAGVFHQLMIGQLAERTGIERDILLGLSTPISPSDEAPDWQEPPPRSTQVPEYRWQPVRRPLQPLRAKKIQLPPIHRLIALLIHQAEWVTELGDLGPLKALQLPDLDMLIAIADLLHRHPDYTLSHVLGYWRGIHGPEQGELLARIAATDLINAPDSTVTHNLTELRDIIQTLGQQAMLALPPEDQLDQLLSRATLDPEDGKIANEIWIRCGETQPELLPKIREVLARTRHKGSQA